MPKPPTLITRKRLREMFDPPISDDTVRRMEEKGDLTRIKFNDTQQGRAYYDLAEVEALIEARKRRVR
jgi:hypothetical protein